MKYWKCMVMLSAVALMSMVSVSAYAQVVALHTGDTNPTSEGWTVNGIEAKGSADVGPPAAWRVNDDGPDQSHLLYRIDSLAFEDALDASGWEFTINTRAEIVTGPNPMQTTGKTAFTYWTSNYGFYRVGLNRAPGFGDGTLNFTVEAGNLNGNFPIINPDAYHEYKFVYDGSTKLAEIFVDDAMVADNVQAKFEGPQPSGNHRVEFGAEQSGEHGDGFYSFVELRGLSGNGLLGDIDEDGDVDGADVLAAQETNPGLIPTVLANYGAPGGMLTGGSQYDSLAVPEPASCLFAGLALVGLGLRRRS